MGGNAHYTSERIVQEVVGILADQIENAQEVLCLIVCIMV